MIGVFTILDEDLLAMPLPSNGRPAGTAIA